MAYPLGVQSFTYREFTIDGLCEELEGTDVEAIELCDVHVTPKTDEDDVAETKRRLSEAGLDVCGYGVVDLAGDPDAAREAVAFADRLGGEYLSVNFPPDDDAVREALVAAGEDHGVDVAIHNHGPGTTYATVEDVLAVLERDPDDRLGACVDTGHFLRSGQTPAEVVPALGGRILALHLKDFLDEETEAVPGEGRLDFADLLGLLDAHAAFDRPLVVEYEADPKNPTPAVERTVAAVERLQ